MSYEVRHVPVADAGRPLERRDGVAAPLPEYDLVGAPDVGDPTPEERGRVTQR